MTSQASAAAGGYVVASRYTEQRPRLGELLGECCGRAAIRRRLLNMKERRAFMVFHLKGKRIGSVPLTKRNKAEASQCMRLSHFKTDASGTEHYNVFGVHRDCRL